MTGAAVLLVERKGRRFLLLAGSGGASAALALAGGLFLAAQTGAMAPDLLHGWLVAGCLGVFMAAFAVGPGVCAWLALSELMPARIRANGMAVALLLNQLVAAAIAFKPFGGSADDLRRDRGLSMLFITHDLELAGAVCDRTCVMYAGQIVETRTADKLLESARQKGSQRWTEFLSPVPEQLRDSGLSQLLVVIARTRAAYGHKDSIREILPEELTEPFRDQLDRLKRAVLRELAER